MQSSSDTRSAIERVDDYFAGSFEAMAGPCSVLVDTDDRDEAAKLLAIAEEEARRIELKFSRYRRDNLVYRINHAQGHAVDVDDETAQLLDYAAACHAMSDGMFDITSGVLRRAWTFDGSDRVPSRNAVQQLLKNVGWHRVQWNPPTLVLPAGMEIDFGGIGKEYAVDRAAALMRLQSPASFIVNFGGDLFISGPRRGNRAWAVGIDDPSRTGKNALVRVDIPLGGIATSGDARRFVLYRGKRLGHILNPKTGWPVEDAPRSVTVVAPTCLEAGTLSTLAFLQGPNARTYLEQIGVQFWIV